MTYNERTHPSSHLPISTDFLDCRHLEGYYWKHYFECSVFKSPFFLSLLEVEFTHIKIEGCFFYNWLFSHPAPLHVVSYQACLTFSYLLVKKGMDTTCIYNGV